MSNGELCPISLREANAFVRTWHRHSLATTKEGGRFAVGIFAKGELVAVAIAGRPVSRALASDPRTLEVTRVCTCPTSPRNSPSRLYRACWTAWRALGGHRLVTYTLSREDGASLRASGLTAVTKVPAKPWNRVGRPRKDQRIYHEDKVRWELNTPVREL